MIGWYVDVYRLPSNLAPDNIKNLSQLIKLDTNRPLLFSSGVNMSPIPRNAWSNAYNLVEAQVGDYVNVIYSPARNYISPSNEEKMLNQFPSLNKSFVNAWKDATTDTSMKYRTYMIHFKSMNRLVGFGVQGYSTTTPVYSVDSTGKTTALLSAVSVYLSFGIFMASDYLVISFPNLVNSYDGSDDWYKSTWQNFRIYSEGQLLYGYVDQYSYDPSTDFMAFLDALFGHDSGKPQFDVDPGLPPDNPYEPGGPSGPTDPDLPPGTFDDSSDPIPDSPLPTISAADTGFTRIYNPTLSQVKALAQYLWTTPDVIATIWNHIKQFFENPMDAIIGFNLVPVHVPDGGTTNFKLMYIDTGVAMTAAANQFVDVDCGTLEVKRYYGSALDQSPYTKVSCFLPYIGTVQLNTDEVMGATLQVKYRVDICSGSCVAKIFIDGNCIYQYSGHCAINIPISSADFSSYVSAAINVAKLAIGAATAGAGGAAMAAGQVAGTEQQTGNMAALQTQGGSSPNLAAIYQGQSQQQPPSQSTTSASFAGISPANISNTVGEIMNAKPHVEHSGSFSGNTGYLGVRRPFIIIERPNMCMPENYQALNGFPAMITMDLSTCNGFTRVQQVQLTGMTATNPEQAEILELLKSGVIL